MGTYRLMLQGPRRFGLFLTTTWRDMYAHLMKNERQGRPTPCAVVIGGDPPVPLTSVARIRGDELGVAGALRGAPLEVVRCETNDLEVPAHAEIVIEGFVPAGRPGARGPVRRVHGLHGVVRAELRHGGHVHHPSDRPHLSGVLQPDAAERVELHPRHRARRRAPQAPHPRPAAAREGRAPARGGRRRRVPRDLAQAGSIRRSPSGRCGRRGPSTPRSRSGSWSSTRTSTFATTSRCSGPCPGTSSPSATCTSTGRRRAWRWTLDGRGGREPARAEDRAVVEGRRRRDAEAPFPARSVPPKEDLDRVDAAVGRLRPGLSAAGSVGPRSGAEDHVPGSSGHRGARACAPARGDRRAAAGGQARSSQTRCMSMSPAGIIWKPFTYFWKTFCSLRCRRMAAGASSMMSRTASS